MFQKNCNSMKVELDWELICKALCVFADFDGTKNSPVCRCVNKVIDPMSELVAVAEVDEASSVFWNTKLPEWKRWNLLLEDERPDPKKLCADFDNPARAADFLTCPPLSEEKCARLFVGVDAPANAYEEHVAKTQNTGKQNELMKAENGGPHKRTMYRLRMLRGNSVREVERQMNRDPKPGLSLLYNGAQMKGFTPKDVMRIFDYLLSILDLRDISSQND